MCDAFPPDPAPVLLVPPPFVLISARVDELEKARVGHVVTLDRERRHVRLIQGKLVVPAKANRASIDAERDAPRGYFDPLEGRHGAIRSGYITTGSPLFFERKTVPDVQQRFLVHRFMLEDSEHRLGAIEQRIAWPIEIGRRPRLENRAVGLV